jgi:formylglycine-generating enzyme required for sulfatase activity
MRIRNDLGTEMVLIPPGVFHMGTDREEAQRLARRLASVVDAVLVRAETPLHEVRISRAFYVSCCEITVGEYRRFVEAEDYTTSCERGERGWMVQGGEWRFLAGASWKNLGQQPVEDSLPVVNLAWEDAVAYCRWLSLREGKAYRLPTEAEWEYACRAGSQTMWFFGEDGSQLKRFAWCGANAEHLLQPVGGKEPNPWGLHDMLGNAREWCGDTFQALYYRDSPAVDPTGPALGRVHVQRGGSIESHAGECRSATRLAGRPVVPEFSGFRIVCEAEAN